MKKAATKAEKKHMGRVADIGCLPCLNMRHEDSPAEIHHPRFGAGASQRSSHYDVIPICPRHHRTGGFGVALHAGQKTWEKIHGTERELLAQVKEILGISK